MERHSEMQNPSHCLKSFGTQDAIVPNHHHNAEWHWWKKGLQSRFVKPINPDFRNRD
jgi:hypothetical protein